MFEWTKRLVEIYANYTCTCTYILCAETHIVFPLLGEYLIKYLIKNILIQQCIHKLWDTHSGRSATHGFNCQCKKPNAAAHESSNAIDTFHRWSLFSVFVLIFNVNETSKSFDCNITWLKYLKFLNIVAFARNTLLQLFDQF